MLRVRGRGHFELGGEPDGLVGHHWAQVPQERNERRDGGQQAQSSGGEEADSWVLLHPEVDVPQGVHPPGVPTDPNQQRQEHENLSRHNLRRREGLAQAYVAAVHDLEARGHQGVAVKTGPPDTHPGHTRADHLPVGHQPHPPLDESQRHAGESPAHAAEPEGAELGVGGVSQVGHDSRGQTGLISRSEPAGRRPAVKGRVAAPLV